MLKVHESLVSPPVLHLYDDYMTLSWNNQYSCYALILNFDGGATYRSIEDDLHDAHAAVQCPNSLICANARVAHPQTPKGLNLVVAMIDYVMEMALHSEDLIMFDLVEYVRKVETFSNNES